MPFRARAPIGSSARLVHSGVISVPSALATVAQPRKTQNEDTPSATIAVATPTMAAPTKAIDRATATRRAPNRSIIWSFANSVMAITTPEPCEPECELRSAVVDVVDDRLSAAEPDQERRTGEGLCADMTDRHATGDHQPEGIAAQTDLEQTPLRRVERFTEITASTRARHRRRRALRRTRPATGPRRGCQHR